MKDQTIYTIRQYLKYISWIIIFGTLGYIVYEHNVHGEKYLVEYRVEQATPYESQEIIYDDCECPERAAMNNLIEFVGRLKLPFFALVIIGIAMFVIDNPKIIAMLKKGDDDEDNP